MDSKTSLRLGQIRFTSYQESLVQPHRIGSDIPDSSGTRISTAADDEDFRVRWSPGKKHPIKPNLVASSSEGWEPAAGYTWVNPGIESDLTVKAKPPASSTRKTQLLAQESNTEQDELALSEEWHERAYRAVKKEEYGFALQCFETAIRRQRLLENKT